MPGMGMGHNVVTWARPTHTQTHPCKVYDLKRLEVLFIHFPQLLLSE